MSTVKKSVKAARGKKPTRDILKECRQWSKQKDAAWLKAFKELIAEHGTSRIIVFTLTEQEKESLELAVHLNDDRTGIPDQSKCFDYAKACTLEMVRCDVESFTASLRNGEAKVVAARKAKP